MSTYVPLPVHPNPGYLEEITGPSSQLDLTYTYAHGSYSCIWHAYVAHIYLNLVIYYSGILCFLTRLVPQLKWMHAFLGRVYVSSMVLSTAASLLVSNTGLPTFVLSSFVWVLLGMILGWFVIRQHQHQMLKLAYDLVDTWIKNGKFGGPREGPSSVSSAVADAMNQIARSKTWAQRFVSYKAAHGILMTVSWMPLAGRFWATGIDDEFTCHTMPVYKAINTTIYATAGKGYANVSLADRVIPETGGFSPAQFFPGGELGWFVFGGLRGIGIGCVVGIGFSVWAARRERATQLHSDEQLIAPGIQLHSDAAHSDAAWAGS